MRLSTCTALFTGMVVLAGGSLANAANPVIWDNGNTGAGETGLSSQLDSAYPFNSQTADDFQFTFNASITDVHWTGLYFNGNALANPGPAFNIFIYASAPSGTTPTGGPGDPSATALASYNTGVGGANQVVGAFAGTFDYSFNLPVAFNAAAGVHYWIAIQSVNNFPPQWGWSTSLNNQLNSAVQGFPLLGTNYWSVPPNAAGQDMAFQLTGVPVPGPGALALLGLAGFAARGRRRQA